MYGGGFGGGFRGPGGQPMVNYSQMPLGPYVSGRALLQLTVYVLNKCRRNRKVQSSSKDNLLATTKPMWDAMK